MREQSTALASEEIFVHFSGANGLKFANSAFYALDQSDQREVLKTCEEVIISKKFTSYQKILQTFYEFEFIPVFTSEEQVSEVTVNGRVIPFYLYQGMLLKKSLDASFFIKIKDNEYYFEDVSPGFLSELEKSKEDVVGVKVKDFLPPHSFRLAEDNYNLAIKSKNSVSWEEGGIYSGVRKYGKVTVTPVYRASEFIGLIGSIHSLTEIENEHSTNFSLLNEIIEGTTDSIFVKDLDGRFIFVNESAASLLNRSKFELIGKRDFDIFDLEFASRFVNSDREVYENGRVKTFVEDFTKDGKDYYFLSVKGPFYNQKGKVAGIFVISKDISDLRANQVELELTNALLKATLDSVSDGIVVIRSDDKTKFTYNKKYLEIWGVDDHFMRSHSYDYILSTFISKLSNPEVAIRWKKALAQDPEFTDVQILEFKDGKRVKTSWLPQKLNGKVIGRVFKHHILDS